MSPPQRPSAQDLQQGLHELAAATTIDADATIRPDGVRRLALHDTLPRINVAANIGAELRLLVVLGEGGMGQVYLARQRGLDRDVALKMVNPKAESKHSASLLMQEGVITGRLEHPNIVPVHLMGLDDTGQPVIVMKRIEGVPWSQLDVGGAQPSTWAGDKTTRHLEIFLDVCNAVAFAHDRGYVHRDIKPANVMIGRFGEVYLLDWGISTKVGSGAFEHVLVEGTCKPLGTPMYLAPEQCLADGIVDERTDVFLLGATLHRMLTGRSRHPGKDLATVLKNVALCLPSDYGDEIADELGQILNKATARNPADRYASAGALRTAVADFMRHRGSIELAHEADALRVRLEQLIEQGGDQSALRRTSTECRFAFMRALKDWPDNARATNGLQRCLEAMTRLELGLGQLDAAQALLDEMPAANATLRAQLDVARRLKVAEAEQFAGLRRMAHELDPTVSRRQRVLLGVAFTLLVVAVVSGTFGELPIVEQTPRAAFYTTLPFVAIYTAVLLGYRKALLATRFNRQVMILFGVALAGTLLNRTLAIVADAPFAYMLGLDLLIIAVVAASTAGTVDRLWYVPAVIWAAGAAAIVLLPQTPVVPYAIAQIGGLVALILIFIHRRSRVEG